MDNKIFAKFIVHFLIFLINLNFYGDSFNLFSMGPRFKKVSIQFKSRVFVNMFHKKCNTPKKSLSLFCTSINKEDLKIGKSKKQFDASVLDPQKQRFIHPQVFKMFQRAQYLIRQGNSTTAQKLLVRCLELNPYDSQSWLALARLEAKTGNIMKSRDIFAEANIRCPNNVHILHSWGHLEQVWILPKYFFKIPL